jgi:hypothetical protein
MPHDGASASLRSRELTLEDSTAHSAALSVHAVRSVVPLLHNGNSSCGDSMTKTY